MPSAAPWWWALSLPITTGWYLREFRIYVGTCSSQVAQWWRTWLPVPEKGIQSLGPEDPLEKGMATHSSILAQRTPWTEKPAGYSPWDHKSGTRPKRLNNKQSSSYSVVPKLAAFASGNLSAMQVQTYWVRNSRGGAQETMCSKPSGDSDECLNPKQPHPILFHFLNDRSTQITGQ